MDLHEELEQMLDDVDPTFEVLNAISQGCMCAICGHHIQPCELGVPTTSGEVVHVVCANELATQAQTCRQRRALDHAFLFVGTVIVTVSIAGIVIGN